MRAATGAAPRILVVEDQEINRALLRATLLPRAEPVPALVEVESLAEAREALADADFDLLLLDVRLPDGNGLDLARELAGTAARPRIVAISASVLPTERQAALDAGCDVFVGKPFSPVELVATLERVLAG